MNRLQMSMEQKRVRSKYCVMLSVLAIVCLLHSSSLYASGADDRSTTPVRLYGSDALRLYLTEPPTEIVQRLYLPTATRIAGVTVELDGPPATNCGSVVV